MRLLLSIKATLENVTDLVPATDDFEYFFGLKCTSCNEPHPKIVTINRVDKHPLSGGKDSSAHFVWSSPQPYSADANEQFAPFLVIECRGLEFTSFDPQGVWKCVGIESGTQFTEVEFEDDEWLDYDEKAKEPVRIYGIESQWSRA